MDALLTALADPTRRQIVALLRPGERTVGELVAGVSVAQSGVSRHLRILHDVGLVQARPRGQQRLYSLRPEPFAELRDWLDDYRALWDTRLDGMQAELRRRQNFNVAED